LKIGLLSDTHSVLPEAVFTHFKEVDEIWHAGDIGNPNVWDRLTSFKPCRGVWGNIDGHELRRTLTQDLIFEIGSQRIYMTHIGGHPGKYKPGILQKLQLIKPNIFICGHSHILKIIYDKKLNLLHLNPGAAGKEGFHKVQTLLRFEINTTIEKLEIIEIGTK
jgi:uncharacterized protein